MAEALSLKAVLSAESLRAHLPEPGTWRPVPAATDRSFWDGFDATTRTALLDQAEQLSGGDWPQLTASRWLDYARTGNRVRYQDPYNDRRRRLAAAVLAACLTDDARWHDEVADGAWLLCEESSWCLPAHDESHGTRNLPALPDVDNPTLDLFAAETGALLAWTHTVLSAQLAERGLADRIVDEVRTRVLVPQRTVDSWVWFGRRGQVGNWNPWINSNVLACSLLLDADRADLLQTVERAIEGLDVFLGGYPCDGACDEGHLYWWRAGASLSECLELLRTASDGVLDAFDLPLVREIGRYPHRVHIAGDWYVNVADGSAKLDADNTCAHVLYRYGIRVGDAEMVAHARAMRGSGPVVERSIGLGRSLFALSDTRWRDEPLTEPPLVQQAWWPDTELLTARQIAGSTRGLFVSVKGGHNGEDHNHNDVGTLLVALDGHPVLVDAGVAEYTHKHFSPDRYEIWSLRSGYHNVPLVDGHEQPSGGEHAARDVRCRLDDSGARIDLDLAAAYPVHAGLRTWCRTVELERAGGGRYAPRKARSTHLSQHHPRRFSPRTWRSGHQTVVVRTSSVPGAVSIGWEPEMSDLMAGTIVRRARITERDGLTPMWPPKKAPHTS
ncbi:heparinase II/III family protein [Tenggerimyces flavus]|uniref:Heparinase II/III family protein n=1 Tax=Tenggerimyces flavus TaxID=1708749 RepID=A0ABV7YJ90_9ACTN|nr:heparinase II/III family protein [Tenggerimyces flavus]MBM7789559.1 hypothetical protein [Tenggerimyces flavus]